MSKRMLRNESPAASSRPLIILLALFGICSWVSTFGVGLLVASAPYRKQLGDAFDAWILFKAIATFTPTNVAVIALLAGFLGGCASLLLYCDYGASPESHCDHTVSRVDEERLAFLRENPVSSALRGFAVYLAFLGGTVLATNAPFENTTQDQYCRMAGAVAILAFAVGYDPTFFKQFISVLPNRDGGGFNAGTTASSIVTSSRTEAIVVQDHTAGQSAPVSPIDR